MRELFLDSGYVVALELQNDQYHERTAAHWQKLMSPTPARLVTTSLVFAEIVTLLSARGQRQRSIQVGDWLFSSKHLLLVDVDRSLFDDGWAYFKQHDDKQYSLTDAVSFVLMKRLGIRTALTFDHHFRQARFDVEP
jgi:uncharacterized protein